MSKNFTFHETLTYNGTSPVHDTTPFRCKDPLLEYTLPQRYLSVNYGSTTSGISYLQVKPHRNLNDTRVVCIHGASHDSFFYHSFQAFIAANGFESFAMDLEGHGKSRKSRPSILGVSLSQYARNVEELLSELGDRRTILVVHSLGFRIALKFLQNSPKAEQIKGVVCIAGVPRQGVLKMLPSFMTSRFSGEQFGGREHAVRYLQSALARDTGKLLNGSKEIGASLLFSSDLRDESTSRVSKVGFEQFRRTHLFRESLRAFLEVHLPQTISRVPTGIPFLVCSSENDRLIPPSVLDKTCSYFTDRGFTIAHRRYNSPAHDMLLDPEHLEVANDITGWLLQHSGS